MMFAFVASWFMIWSAGGQDEQPCEVNSSTTMGPSASCAFDVSMPVKSVSAARRVVRICFIMILDSCLVPKMLHGI